MRQGLLEKVRLGKVLYENPLSGDLDIADFHLM